MSNTVPEGWKVIPFEVVFTEIKNGCSLDQNGSGNGLPVTRIETISNGKIDYSKTGWLYTTQDIERFRIDKGDILFSHINSLKHIGKTAIKDDDRLLYHGMNLLRFKIDRSKFSPTYLQNLLSWEVVREDMRKKAKQAINQASLNVQDIKTTAYPIPPLPEQQKIAAILSSVDDVIEKTRAQIDKLKDLKTGMMQELLTKGIGLGGIPHTEFKDSPVGKIPVSWQTKAMGEVFDFKNGVNKDKTAFGHGVPIISYKNVYVGGGIVDSNINALVEMNDQELERFRVNYGDVFFTRTSETPDEIGFTNVYLGSRNNVVFNGFVIRGRQKSNIFDPDFLKYVFQGNVVRKQMMDNSKFTTRAGISGESLGRIKLAIPDIPEQQVIASILDTFQNRIDRVRNKLMAHESLKKALMQDLLTGKVRVSQKESAVA
ncbi:restriction endonuclease subunit S [Marinobacter piscensis]|uniref:restriction endonuclease subunit S n=1 Tax=Marinobacter piscensis TaxID=1562308 RepID=UPI0011A1AFA5|nr:restriction endonuclease subunit S [Marinobacter piscensis]